MLNTKKQRGGYRIIAFEGLDGTGKSTAAQALAEQTGSKYFYFTEGNPLARFRRLLSAFPPIIRFLYYTACSFDTHRQAGKMRFNSDVYVDRSPICTLAYHKNLGVPDWLITKFPQKFLKQIDLMVYFSASETVRKERLNGSVKSRSQSSLREDSRSFAIAQQVHKNYLSVFPAEKTIVILTDHKTKSQVVSELKEKLYLSSKHVKAIF